MTEFEKRRSPRAFSKKKISAENIEKLFEAASTAPSAYNEQPWKYIYATKENPEAFAKFLNCLIPFNQNWAKESCLLVLSIAKKFLERNNSPNKYYLHDTGAANAYMVLQATNLGFQGHQMGGYDRDKTIETFNIDTEKYEPVTFIAFGYEADISTLSEEKKLQETKPRERKEISEFVIKIEDKKY